MATTLALPAPVKSALDKALELLSKYCPVRLSAHGAAAARGRK